MITESRHCIYCATQTYWAKQEGQRLHLWSDSPWCNQGRPTPTDTIATIERTRMALGRDDEQTECMLLSGEVVR